MCMGGMGDIIYIMGAMALMGMAAPGLAISAGCIVLLSAFGEQQARCFKNSETFEKTKLKIDWAASRIQVHTFQKQMRILTDKLLNNPDGDLYQRRAIMALAASDWYLAKSDAKASSKLTGGVENYILMAMSYNKIGKFEKSETYSLVALQMIEDEPKDVTSNRVSVFLPYSLLHIRAFNLYQWALVTKNNTDRIKRLGDAQNIIQASKESFNSDKDPSIDIETAIDFHSTLINFYHLVYSKFESFEDLFSLYKEVRLLLWQFPNEILMAHIFPYIFRGKSNICRFSKYFVNDKDRGSICQSLEQIKYEFEDMRYRPGANVDQVDKLINYSELLHQSIVSNHNSYLVDVEECISPFDITPFPQPHTHDMQPIKLSEPRWCNACGSHIKSWAISSHYQCGACPFLAHNKCVDSITGYCYPSRVEKESVV